MKTLRQSFCLFAVVIAASMAPGAHAQSVAPSPAPTIITSAPYTISKPGYYQLGANLTYAGNSNIANDAIITINAGNVILDFGGHYLSGPSTNTSTRLYGVYANERGNLTIINGTITFCLYGIYIKGDGSDTTHNINQRIDNMLVSDCYAYGIFVHFGNYSSLSNSRISSIGGTTLNTSVVGVAFGGGTGNQIINTVIATVTGKGNSGYGISATNNVLVKGCSVSNVSDPSSQSYGMYEPLYAVDCTITNCAEGIHQATKYRAVVTSGCTTPFNGGTAVGYENN